MKTKDRFQQLDSSSIAGHVPNSNTEGSEPQKCERKWSERGRDYFAENQKQISRIHQLLDENLATLTTLEVERDSFDKLMDLFNEAQNVFVELIDNERDKQESYHWFDVNNRECIEARTSLVEKHSRFVTNEVKTHTK